MPSSFHQLCHRKRGPTDPRSSTCKDSQKPCWQVSDSALEAAGSIQSQPCGNPPVPAALAVPSPAGRPGCDTALGINALGCFSGELAWLHCPTCVRTAGGRCCLARSRSQAAWLTRVKLGIRGEEREVPNCAHVGPLALAVMRGAVHGLPGEGALGARIQSHLPAGTTRSCLRGPCPRRGGLHSLQPAG